MDIIKASGEEEKFEKEKVFQSLRRAGAGPRLAAEICQRVAKVFKPGMSTNDIFEQTLNFLEKENSILAARYNLKKAIMELGPTGFPFERFVAEILKEYGYETKVGKQVRGYCVTHEVDVIAEKGKERFMIECKYHNSHGIKSDLKVALYTYARFLDIKMAWEKIPGRKCFFHQGCPVKYSSKKKESFIDKCTFNGAWLTTNTKCTSQAIRFARCQGLKIISWRYPSGGSLNDLIENRGLYPITILPSLSGFLKKRFAQNNIILAKDLLRYSQNDFIKTFGIRSDLAKRIKEEVDALYSI